MAEVLFRAKLQRENTSVPWGFRLQGGSEFSQPLTILKVGATFLGTFPHRNPD